MILANFRMFFLLTFLSLFLLLNANDNEDAKTDILFLKIQELENEIADLRNIIESQNFLINKLINESIEEDKSIEETDIAEIASNSNIRFKGIDDQKSKDQVYGEAIASLESQDLERAFTLFKYFNESFSDNEKSPLTLFWLGEISFINNNLEESKNYFQELISEYTNHYRVPLAHKKIGDIHLKKNEIKLAKDRYAYVVREYPNNSASSLALQLLKNME